MKPTSVTRRQAVQRIVAVLPLLGRMSTASASASIEKSFDELLKAQGYDNDGPGLACRIQQSGRMVFQRCIGFATIHDHRPVTSKTMFELASVSKPITATAVLILHERKQLSVNDPVRKHIPELPEYDPSNPIRIRDLLLQTSGLASYLDFKDVTARHGDYWVNDDYVIEFAKGASPLRFPTGQKFQYNNSNYMLLAVVIARVARKKYGQFLRDAIFDPAGMLTAFANEGPGSVPQAADRVDALGYEQANGAWKANWGAPPARHEKVLTVGDGGIWCSLEDMAALDTAIQTGKLLTAASMKTALAPSRTHDGLLNDYGFGWGLDLNPHGGLTGYGHTGGWGGFRTSYHHDLESRRSIVILRNGRPLETDRFTRVLSDAIDRP